VRIAQIAPLVESVPPRLYGGTERVVSWLTEELVAQGHDVTLFASGDSQTAAKLEAIVPRALRLDGIHNSLPYNIIALDRVAEQMEERGAVAIWPSWAASAPTRARNRPSKSPAAPA